ncbi:N-acetylmuramoyl-L-alanine amidase [Erwinia mallotivora]|uniref:peptidoglycan recognition protein family protein n=1 Tax=Erwinia mallotivora TaxID=69222 RepID=UPI0021C0E0A3|nr:peptidoglycan recognition family protein [Erwinia mallotivora]
MLFIDKNGMTDAERIVKKRFTTIERQDLNQINGIVVHQTSSPTADSTFNSYQESHATGAHFLIDKDGTIYQTASLYKVTWHVGQMKSRCYLEKKCPPGDLKIISALERSWRNYQKVSETERKKTFPSRFPANSDSIGIEIVGMAYNVDGKKDKVYESVNDRQNSSLKWLITELTETLHVARAEIYRHPEIARKNITKASTAKW